MFNQGDYRMVKAQQERFLAEAQKQDGRAQGPNPLLSLVRRLAAGSKKAVPGQPSHKRAEARV